MELLFDNEFSLSDGEISERGQMLCYKGKARLTKELIEDLVRQVGWQFFRLLWINQRIQVKEQLELLLRGRLG